MKIWMKYLLGVLLGAALAIVLPDSDAVRHNLAFLFELSVRIGSYALIPLVFFSLPVAIYELNEDKEFWRGLGRILLHLFLSVAVFSLIGVTVAALVKPGRIPLIADAASLPNPVSFQELLRTVFPQSAFSVLNSGSFLLPICLLAVLIGLSFSHDKSSTKPALVLFESFSRVFYQINSFFVEFLGILVIVTSISSVSGLRTALAAELYRPLLFMIGIEVLVVTLLLIPAFLFFTLGKKNPYRHLYGLIAPSLAALVSGDIHFPLGALMKHAKESLGIRRRSNAVVLPLAAIFGRAGTALITASVFIVILSSYSSLGISAKSLIWILSAAPIITLLLGAAPGQGTMTALIALCALYGKGFENGYLIVAPIALPLISAGAFLDILWAGATALVIGSKNGHVERKDVRFFV